MSRFVHGRQLGASIRRVTGGGDVRLAVAYWGDGAVGALLAGAPRRDARVVYDASSGSTNPGELERMGAPDNPNLRHLPNLHAKVYVSSAGRVVGSANASNNGVGFPSDAKLVEAATFHEPGGKAYLAGGDSPPLIKRFSR